MRPLTTFDIHSICFELNDYLSGSYVDKIYQPSPQEILIKINNKKENEKQGIYIHTEKFLAITKKQFHAPTKPSLFAMTCRKYLKNGIIEQVKQHEFDRIIHLFISKKEGTYQLIIELFKNGNILLVSPENKIILPLKRQQWKTRILKSKQPYQPPPSQTNPLHLSKQDFFSKLKGESNELIKSLALNINLGGYYAEELLRRVEVEKKQKSSDVDQVKLETLYDAFDEMMNNFKNNSYKPTLYLKDDKIVDVTPIPFQNQMNFEKKIFDGLFSIALDNLVEEQKPQQHQKQTTKEDDRLDQLKRQLNQQEQSLKKFEEKIKEKKEQGDLIYLHFQTVTSILESMQKILKTTNKHDHIAVFKQKYPSVKNIDLESRKITLELTDTNNSKNILELDLTKSAADNANKAYQIGKKHQEKLNGAKKALKNTQKLIQQQQQDIQTLKKTQKEEVQKTKHKKTHWYEHYRWFITSNGNLCIGGRDAKTNESAVKKYLQPKDRYAHADIHGAPSVILKNSDPQGQMLQIDEQSLKEACEFAASYSRAWNQFAETQAYWVNPEQVSQTAQSGEYVPRGAFIIRGKRNYQKCIMELSVGITILDEETKIMAGPTSAIQKQCKKYITLTPGPTKKADISKEISQIFNVPTETIDRALPPGGCSIVNTKNIKDEEEESK